MNNNTTSAANRVSKGEGHPAEKCSEKAVLALTKIEFVYWTEHD